MNDTLEKFVEDVEACRKVCDLMLMWKMKDALEEIKRLLPSSESPSPYNHLSSSLLALLYESSSSVIARLYPQWSSSSLPSKTTAFSILQTPFYHYKLGSLRHINQIISHLVQKFQFKRRHKNNNNSIHAFNDEFFDYFVDHLYSTGFLDLSEHMWYQKEVKGKSSHCIIQEVIQNTVPYVDQIHQIIGGMRIIPISSRLKLTCDVLNLKTKYKMFTKYMKDKAWDQVSNLLSNHPSTLLTPYFWDDCDLKKNSPLEVAFMYKAPYKIVELILNIGGPNMIHGAYNMMHKIYPFHRACMDQPIEILHYIVDVVGPDIVCTLNHGNSSLRTPLQMALNFKNDIDTIRFLIVTGGKKSLTMNTKKGVLNPILCACISRFDCPLEVLLDLITIGGRDIVYTRGHFGYTPLHYALHSTTKGIKEECIELLVNVGGKRAVLAYDKDEYTPLHFACRHASLNTIRVLMAVGGESAIHATTVRNLETPILSALLASRFDTASLILESSSVSPFKIGQDKIDSLLGIFVESEKRAPLTIQEYTICLDFIMENGAIEQILHSLLHHFDYGVGFISRQRPIMAVIDKLGNDATWKLILPYLQRSLENSSSFLHTIIHVLSSSALHLSTVTSKEILDRQSLLCMTKEKQCLNYALYVYRKEEDKQSCLFLINEIMRRLPKSVKMYDDEGRLPLHVACEKGLPYGILKSMIDADPDSIWDIDGKTGLPFLVLAAAGYDSNLLKCENNLNDVFDLFKQFTGIVNHFIN